MLWDEIISTSLNSAEFVTMFFNIFNEEQLLGFLLKLNGSNREQEESIVSKDIEPEWVTYDLESIDPDPTFWDYEELCMIYLFEKFDVLLTTNPKEGIAKFS